MQVEKGDITELKKIYKYRCIQGQKLFIQTSGKLMSKL